MKNLALRAVWIHFGWLIVALTCADAVHAQTSYRAYKRKDGTISTSLYSGRDLTQDEVTPLAKKLVSVRGCDWYSFPSFFEIEDPTLGRKPSESQITKLNLKGCSVTPGKQPTVCSGSMQCTFGIAVSNVEFSAFISNVACQSADDCSKISASDCFNSSGYLADVDNLLDVQRVSDIQRRVNTVPAK